MKADLEDGASTTVAHRVVGLDALVLHVEDGAGPVGLVLINGDQDDVLREDVRLGLRATQKELSATWRKVDAKRV